MKGVGDATQKNYAARNASVGEEGYADTGYVRKHKWFARNRNKGVP